MPFANHTLCSDLFGSGSIIADFDTLFSERVSETGTSCGSLIAVWLYYIDHKDIIYNNAFLV